jgi:RNA polymerase sigma factor (sigma-70 family)
MSTLHLRSILKRLWNDGGIASAGALADADLLRRWVASRDPAAFEVLLWRHGPMIWELCRRLLRREQDAEDVFQSAFFALALKGKNISKGEAVSGWLYTVAYRAALQLRGAGGLPETLDPRLFDRLAGRAGEDVTARELRTALDEEVRHLPERYRAAFVLCYLEGLTNEEAAQRLGRPVGTVVSRLARARQWLRRRLTGRGLAPAVVVSLLSAKLARAGLPSRLAEEVTRAAALVAAGKAAGAVSPTVAALTQGVLGTMCKSKMITVAFIVLGVAALGAVGTSLSVVQERERHATASWYEAQVAHAGQPSVPVLSPGHPHTPSSAGGFPNPQPSVGPAGGTTPAGKAADSKATQEQLRDEVEVLEAQVEVKRAHVKAAQITYAAAQDRLREIEQLHKKGVTPVSQLTQAKTTLSTAEAELMVREAELREPLVRLTQAKRRLAGLERPATPAGGRTQMRERLRGLEQKLDALRKEVETMRKELGEEKPPKQ